MSLGWLLRVVLVALGMLSASVCSAQAQNRFWLVNDTGRVIERAFVSSSRVSDWGPDILGTAVLLPGQRVWVTPSFGDCVLDIRITYQSGGEESRMQVNACSLSQIVFGRSAGAVSPGAGAASPYSPAVGNPSFVFVNGTPGTIREIYVSLSSDSNWGPDRLGANILAPGQRLAVGLPRDSVCTVDIRVVYMDGRADERRRLETCSRTELVWARASAGGGIEAPSPWGVSPPGSGTRR
jgi:hypothetical protein